MFFLLGATMARPRSIWREFKEASDGVRSVLSPPLPPSALLKPRQQPLADRLAERPILVEEVAVVRRVDGWMG